MGAGEKSPVPRVPAGENAPATSFPQGPESCLAAKGENAGHAAFLYSLAIAGELEMSVFGGGNQHRGRAVDIQKARPAEPTDPGFDAVRRAPQELGTPESICRSAKSR